MCYNDLEEKTCLRKVKGLMSIHVDVECAQCLPKVLREYGGSIINVARLSIWLQPCKIPVVRCRKH